MHGPAQEAMYMENREFVDTACSDIVCISTSEVRPISTLVPLLESGTRGAASAASDLLYRASSVASPRGLPTTGADYDIRPILHVSPDQSAPGSFDVAVAGIVGIEDRVGCPPVRPALPLVTLHSFIDEGPQTLSAAQAVAVASPSPALSNRSLRPTRAYRDRLQAVIDADRQRLEIIAASERERAAAAAAAAAATAAAAAEEHRIRAAAEVKKERLMFNISGQNVNFVPGGPKTGTLFCIRLFYIRLNFIKY